jgi:hypothetical protein
VTIRLSAHDSAAWESGGWLSLEIQESIIEDLDRQNITESVVVTLDTGEVLFAITQGGIA